MLKCSVLLAATVLTSAQNYGSGGNGHANGICSNTTCASDIAGAVTDSCYCGPLQTFKPKPLDNYYDTKKGHGDYSKDGGLCLQKYNGYWCDNLDFFKENHPLSGCNVENKINEQYNVTVDGDTSYQYSGVFKVKRSGRFSFQLLCSDGCAMTLGGKTMVQSPNIKNQPNADGVPCDNHVYLKKGAYKFNIFYGIASADLLTNKEKQISYKWKGDRADSSFTTKLSDNYFPGKCSCNSYYEDSYGSNQNSYGSNQNSYGSKQNSYGSKQNSYGTKHDSYDTKHDSYGTKHDSYGSKYNSKYDSYGSKHDSYDTKHDSYSSKQHSHGTKQNSYGTKHDSYSSKQNSYGTKQNSYGTKQNSYGTKQNSYGTKQNSYGTKQNSYGSKHDSKHDSYGSKHGSYGSKHDSYGSKHDSYDTKHDSYGTKHESYDTRQNSYDSKHDSYGSKHDSYGSKHNSYGSKHDSYDIKHDSYGTNQNSYYSKHDSYGSKHDSKQNSYGTKHGSHDSKHDSYGSKHDNYGTKHDSYDSKQNSYDTKQHSYGSKHDSKHESYGTKQNSYDSKHDSYGSKHDSYSSDSNHHSNKSYSLKPKIRPYGPSPPPPPTPSNSIQELLKGPIRTNCKEPICASGGCPRGGVYMLRVEPQMGTYRKNEAWAGAHITMSSQENYDTAAEKALALKKWGRLKESFDSFEKFKPTAKNWKNFKTTPSCICGMLLRALEHKEEFVILNKMGQAARTAGFKDARLEDYHITIANHIPNNCDGTNANIPNTATDFANAGYTLVMVHFDRENPSRMYRVRQHKIS